MNYNLIEKKWWEASSNLNITIKKWSSGEKERNEKSFDKVIDKLTKYINSMPEEVGEVREKWLDNGNKLLHELIKRDNIFNTKNIDSKMRDNIIQSTSNFIKKARAFNEYMKEEDIGQAMRNVWIVNLLQGVFNEEIYLNDAIFAYSMLYPYTDNYIDNAKININEKAEFNKNLTKKLKGEPISSDKDYYNKIFCLVEMIEKIYDRNKFPQVYESLLEIQEGQILSMKQQHKNIIPYEKNILGISIKKGASSVLVDGNLVRGFLSEKEEDFCLGYGFILQLADDLQDVKEDIKNNHVTIMSQLAKVYAINSIANKLMNFTEEFFENHICLRGKDVLKELIKNNCLMLILFSIINSSEFFTNDYIDQIEEYVPFSAEYVNSIEKKIRYKIERRKKYEIK
ncbi:MAG: class 1 isoprenoid biosynthesis enzyme [Clostridiaceae bacterium]|nr:class 1 isoprenoid biosynthesis enzyme [Clostridiaceae bacterium]